MQRKNKSLNFLPLRNNQQEKDRHPNINVSAVNRLLNILKGAQPNWQPRKLNI